MSLIFVIRHGERADNASKEEIDKIELAFDPHLTTVGTKQAYLTGELIKNLVKEAIISNLIQTKNPKYLILTSPFLRTLQTANHIAIALGIDNLYNKALYLEESISEYLAPKFYRDDPMPNLYIRTRSSKEIEKYVEIETCNDFVKDNIKPVYPENVPIFASRVEYGYRYIKDHVFSEKEYEDVVLIFVTHGYSVQVILEIYEEFDFVKDVDYCSVQQLYYPEPNKDKNQCKVLLKQFSDHIYQEKKIQLSIDSKL